MNSRFNNLSTQVIAIYTLTLYLIAISLMLWMNDSEIVSVYSPEKKVLFLVDMSTKAFTPPPSA